MCQDTIIVESIDAAIVGCRRYVSKDAMSYSSEDDISSGVSSSEIMASNSASHSTVHLFGDTWSGEVC
jgi:hypothetical protein